MTKVPIARAIVALLILVTAVGAGDAGVLAHTIPLHPYHYSVGSCDTWLTHWPYGTESGSKAVAETHRQACTGANTVGVRVQYQDRLAAHNTYWSSWVYETDNWVTVMRPSSGLVWYNPVTSSHYYLSSYGSYVTANLNF